MNKKRKKALEAEGWTVGSAEEFLGLSPEEAAYVELKLSLSDALRRRRSSGRITQSQLARLMGSSQSRVAKMEACDPTVSIDLLVRALLALGASQADISNAVNGQDTKQAS